MNPWSKTLIEIAQTLNENSIPYLVVASGALKVEGVKLNPYDIDIFTTEKHLRKCFKLFSDIKTTDIYFFEDEAGKYLEFKASKHGILIEFCELDNIDTNNTKVVNYKGVAIPIPKDTLVAELERNKQLGRTETVKAIEQFIQKRHF